MSDDDRDIDVESDDGDESDSRQSAGRGSTAGNYYSQKTLPRGPKNSQTSQAIPAEKRAHHNALERKRRDHIKDSFSGLRDSVPSLAGEKVASRAQILKKAADYIIYMRKKNSCTQNDIDELKRQNVQLESQVKKLEKARAKLMSTAAVEVKNEMVKYEVESDNSELEIVHHHLHLPQQQRRVAASSGAVAPKKAKLNNYQ